MSNDQLNTYHSALKRRSAKEEEVKVVLKPRKMNLIKPKRVPSKTSDYANSALLVFPTDSLGITTELKAAMIRAGSRIGKDKAALALVQEVLDMGVKHILARFEQNCTSQGLKRRVDTSPQEEEDAAENAPEAQQSLSYDDMVAALKEAGVKLESRKKADVEAAFNSLEETTGEE